MAAVWSPYSPLIREPNLLIPGKKPVGPVKICQQYSGKVKEVFLSGRSHGIACSGTIQNVFTPQGTAVNSHLETITSSGGNRIVGSQNRSPADFPFWAAVQIRLMSAGDNLRSFFSSWADNNKYEGYMIGADTESLHILFGDGTGAAGENRVSHLFPSVAGRATYVFRANSLTDVDCWREGTRLATSGSTGTGTSYGPGANPCVFGATTSLTRPSNVSALIMGDETHNLTDAEAAALSRDPFRVLEPA